jgi:hypothetical protein
MTPVPGTFRDLFCAGIDNFKVAWTHYKPRIAPALVLAIAPNLVNSLVVLFTIGSSALGGTRDMTIADPSAALYRLVLVVLLPGWIFSFFAGYDSLCMPIKITLGPLGSASSSYLTRDF